ncbi:Fe(3+)-hydroxamate ABC transporter permease FhuB [Neisseria chenwenguii]|uniref:Fe(3+)-hydroxamate ABC transporter permease FhuB n=1 Tax=Neisseria chenwenguii TaxID=1853278 RepID=UPI000F4D6BF9|nr:Fe(3+)-hydroxamate ABC transporter permease FhuB [Neisseria chenwenguii]ROV55478.1 Fe(3+)-hydroxamate ABC transporter permease FhuB [Neisseria chenwenguii]
MVDFFRRPVARLTAALLLLCGLSAFWVLKLEWTLPFTQLFAEPDTLPLEALTVQNNTLPRMAMALLAGGSTAAATMLMQQIMRNPLASDSTLAVSGGAQTALVLAAVFAPAWLDFGTSGVAFAGAAAALCAVFWLSVRRELLPLTVILAGLVVSLYLGSLTGIVMLFYSEETRGVMQWGSGSLVQDSWHDTLQISWRILAAALLVGVLLKPLAVMGLGDTQAESLGIPVKKIRLLALAAAAFLSANVVAFVGMMGFVGLAAATVVRQTGVRTLPARLAASFALGGLMLMLTDNGLMLLKHYRQIDLPAGAVAALIGAPLLLWLMMKAPAQPVFQTASERGMTVLKASPLLKRLPLVALAVLLLALFVGRSDGVLPTFDTEYFAFRYPRVLLAAATGTMLALAGVMLQRLTQNPMASPELLGISSGTAFGAMAAVFLFDLTSGSGAFWLAGTVSALVSLALFILFNRKNGLAPEKILLTGMALAALADAAIRVWTASGDFRVQQLLLWMSGSTYQATPESALVVAAAALVLFCAVLPLQRWLGLLGLDAVVAQSVGVNVPFARLVLIVLSAVLTALSTLLIGPLSFVGLLAPHLAYMLGARLPKQQLAAAALTGTTVMTAADWLGRQVLFPYEVPAGLMATLIGGAYFMRMMRRM